MLLGNPSRLPEYSAGLDRVDATRDANGIPTAYLCQFKQQEGQSISPREVMRWYEPDRGYASVAEEPNAFGLTNAVTLVRVEPGKSGTLVTWDQHYDAADLDTNRTVFDQALADIAERLVARFGGRVVERYVDAGH